MTVLRLLAFRPLQANEIPQSSTVNVQQVAQAQSHSEQVTIAQAPVEAVVQETVQPVVEEFALDDDYELEDNFVQSSTAAVHEPSSDDFLDDVADQHVQEVVNEETVVQAAEPTKDHIIFDASAEDGLFGFDESVTETVEVESEASSDDFLLAEYLPEQASTTSETSQVAATSDITQAEIQSASVTALNNESATDQTLMPQDILKILEQALEGEWTVEKWEYWFRNSQLSPAVQELAQYGIMVGSINAASTFHVPEQYQQLLTQLQHNLEAALKAQWSQTVFSVKFEDVEQLTPYTMQHDRKARAFKRAEELLHAEPAVQDLLKQFDGELHNIQLK